VAELIVSVSGIRGIVGETLTPDVALRFAQALGTQLKSGTVLVSRDGRPSGQMLGHAVISGLMQTGCDVVDLGILPTPTVGVAVRHFQAVGAIQITASHNPAPWNGLKLFGADGAVLPPEAGLEVKQLFESEQFTRKSWNSLGKSSATPTGGLAHLHAVLRATQINPIAERRFRVFLDGNGGSGGPLATQLLQELGCAVIAHNTESTGHFAHEAEPIPAHLVDVAPSVRQNHCQVGFVLDPDADRLALLDERGECVSEELTLALAIQYRLREATGPVVVNMSTSRVIEDLARRAGCAFFRSAVGEANVVQEMRNRQALIGGEGNGGVIDPRIGWVRDPFIGMSLILSLLAQEQKPLSELLAKLPKYEMRKTKFAVSRSELPSRLEKLRQAWPEASVNTVDGLRLDTAEWWLHVRPSNTEPVVRIIAEAASSEQVEAICQQAEEIIVG
jgi:phosphomannomutase